MDSETGRQWKRDYQLKVMIHTVMFFNSLLKSEDKSNQCSTIIQNILGEENINATSDYWGEDTPFKGESIWISTLYLY